MLMGRQRGEQSLLVMTTPKGVSTIRVCGHVEKKGERKCETISLPNIIIRAVDRSVQHTLQVFQLKIST